MQHGGTWWAEHAWLGGDHNAAGVLLGVKDGTFTSVTPGVPVPPPRATALKGVTLPGLVNAHSHAFHRSLRGRTHAKRGTFWSWRDTMYRAAAALDPDLYLRLARAVFAEMVLAGYTTVGEFHYLHHDRDGRPYADPNQMGNAVLEAASEAGIRMTLIDTCYLSGGFDQAGTEGVQRRFSDRDASRWCERVVEMKTGDRQRMAAAVHSVRAVPPDAIRQVAAFSTEMGWPLHAHVSEQRAEVDGCLAATGKRPLELLESATALDSGFTAVHAVHSDPRDVVMLGDSGAHVCACPTTERDLGDGIGPFARMRDLGVHLCLGSDSHAVIDGFEESRALEMGARQSSEQRVVFGAPELLRAATTAGMESLGWPCGGLAPGQPADFVSIRTDSRRTAGSDPTLAATAIFAASAADVDTVVVGGDTIVEGGEHVTLGDPSAAMGAIVEEVWAWRP